MDRLLNVMKAQAAGLDSMQAVPRFALVSSFDPSTYAARVLIQPENIMTGWLPVLSAWVGAGWGLAAPLTPGAQVLVVFQEGDAEHGVVVGAVWSAVDTPLPAPAGELWLVHQSGSSLKLGNDGTIKMTAPTVEITGNLVVSGDVSDRNGANGTLESLRAAYDGHTHGVPQGGETGQPSETV